MSAGVRVDVSVAKSTIQYAAQQALKSRLYEHESWMFYSILKQPESIIKMATAFINRKRVGISVLWDYDKLDEYKGAGYADQIGCFVNPIFRRHKIGTMLVGRMNVHSDIVNGTGVAGSRQFWETVRPEAN